MKQLPIKCSITDNLDKMKQPIEGDFIELANIFNTWFAIVIVSGKLERYDVDIYDVKIK